MSLKTRILRTALFWTWDAFELLCLFVFVGSIGYAALTYSEQNHAPQSSVIHKIDTRAPEYAHPKPHRVRVAKLEQGDID